MTNQNRKPEELLESYLKGTCNGEEKRLVEDWYNQISATATVSATAANSAAAVNAETAIQPEQRTAAADEKLRREIWEQLPGAMPLKAEPLIRRLFNPVRLAAAASLLICMGIAVYQFSTQNTSKPEKSLASSIAPGGNKAFLTLSNGERIVLDNEASADIKDQNGVRISKTANGQLIYTIVDAAESNSGKIAVLNKIETPKGGQYQVVLPDGTKVWLNSSSSLRYPASFASLKERRVELQGEAYFEVAHRDNLPFKVMTGDHEVKVLGTHFNVMAYPEEQSIRTVLLQGSVSISSGLHSQKIKPGQESIVNDKSKSIRIEKADLDKTMAWRNGRFEFDNTDLPEIMRQLARWYDVTIDYRLTENPGKFGGGISKDQTLQEVLDLIAGNGICHFKIEGRKVIVLP